MSSVARSTSGPAIELIKVSRRFLTPDGKSMTAIRDFTMTVARGEFVAVVGPTGCGKSTTLNLVTGLASPSAGEVRVFGIEGRRSHELIVERQRPDRANRYQRQRSGIVFPVGDATHDRESD